MNKKARAKKMEQLLLYVPLIALILSIGFNLYQYFYNKSLTNLNLEKITPEIECYYKYYADPDEYRFFINNTGLIDCENIWVEEKIYALIENEVYEGRDVPHFNYVVFEGSRRRMFDLEKEAEKEIKLPKEQKTAIYQLKSKFNAKVVSRWLFTFTSAKSSKTYNYEKYFIFNEEDRTFVGIDDFVGGIRYLNRIKDYISTGNKKTINIFDLTNDFELESPDVFLINADYSVTPLYPWTKITIDQFNSSKLFWSGKMGIQPDDELDEGSLFYTWKIEDGKWEKGSTMVGKVQLITKVIRMPLSYLSSSEAEKVRENPKLLKYFDKNRIPPEESIETIFEKAKEKFFKSSK